MITIKMSFVRTKKARYIFIIVSLVFLGVVFGLFFPKEVALAQTAGNSVANFFANQISKILYEVVSLLGRLLVEVIQILVAIAQYNDFIKATAVVKGWVIVRDICNMFFIAILLVIAFGTILKWETYRYNKLLGRLILMAFLINFSKFICGFFIDIFQVLMLTFVNAFAGVAAGNFVASFGLDKMLALRKEQGAEIEFSGVLGALILAIFLLTIAIIVIVVMTVILLLRILVLWLLVVLSPLAFLLRSWPGMGERYSSQWWTSFGSNLTSGPVLAFFIWLSLTVMTNTSGGQAAQEGFDLKKFQGEQEKDTADIQEQDFVGTTGSPLASKASSAISEISESDQLLSYIISISLLVGSLMMASRMGVMGGQIAGSALTRIQKGLTRAATLGAAAMAGGALFAGAFANRKQISKAGGFVGGKTKDLLARKIFHEHKKLAWMTPTFWQGFFRRGERLKDMAQKQTMGMGEYVSEYVFKGKEAAMPWHELARAEIVNERRALIKKMMGEGGDSRQQIALWLEKASQTGGWEGDVTKQAMLPLAVAQGNWDDRWEYCLQHKLINESNAKDWGFDSYEQATRYSPETSRIMACKELGIDRNLYDPIKILKNNLQSMGEKGDLKDWEEVYETYLHPANTKKLKEKYEQEGRGAEWEEREKEINSHIDFEDKNSVLSKAREQARVNAANASLEDQQKLNAMATYSRECQRIGHQENVDAIKDPINNKAYMIDFVEAGQEAAGEAKKEQARRVIQSMCPYAFISKVYNPRTGEIESETDFDTQSRSQRVYAKSLLPNIPLRDLGQAAPRIYPNYAGAWVHVGDEKANFDLNGGFYDGEKEFDDRNIQDKINEEMDADEVLKKEGLMENLYLKHLKKGKSAEQAKEAAMAERMIISEKRWDAAKELDPIRMNAFWRVAFYGAPQEDRQVPEEWQHIAYDHALTSDFVAEGKEAHDLALEKSKIKKKRLLDYKLAEGLITPEHYKEEKDKYDVAFKKAETEGLQKKKMTDISADRQNATRDKIGQLGEAFWLSDEYKKNQDKYYTQEQYNYNRQGINDLQKQENVSRMTGMKTAMAKSQQGGSAALAVNFDDEMFKGLGLTGAGLNLRGEEMAQAIDRLSDKYLEELIAKNEELAAGEKLTEDQMLSKAEEFAQSLKKASSLRLVNKNRKGVDVRHILAHENFHDQIDRHFQPEDLNEMWQKMGKEGKAKASGELANMGYDTANMNSQEIMHEYLAEGLANQTRYALPGGFKLSPELIKKSQDLGIKVKGPESAEESPEIKELTTDSRDLVKLARQQKVRKIARRTASALTGRVKGAVSHFKKEKEEEALPSVKTPVELAKELYPQLQISEAEKNESYGYWKEAQKNRQEKEALYKTAKAERDRKVIAYNKEIEENEKMAREAAEKGETGNVKKYNELANNARKNAFAEDDKLAPIAQIAKGAKQSEEAAEKEAQKSVNKFDEIRKKAAETIKERQLHVFGGQEGFEKHLDWQIEVGLKNNGGDINRLSNDLSQRIEAEKKKIANAKSNYGFVPVKMELEAGINMHNWQEELKRVEKMIGDKKDTVEVGVKTEPKVIPSAEIPAETRAELAPHLANKEVVVAKQKTLSACNKLERGAISEGELLTAQSILELTKTLNDGLRDLEASFKGSIKEVGDKNNKASKFVEEKVTPVRDKIGGIMASNLRDEQVRSEDTLELRNIARYLKSLLESNGRPASEIASGRVERIGEE